MTASRLAAIAAAAVSAGLERPFWEEMEGREGREGLEPVPPPAAEA